MAYYCGKCKRWHNSGTKIHKLHTKHWFGEGKHGIATKKKKKK